MKNIVVGQVTLDIGFLLSPCLLHKMITIRACRHVTSIRSNWILASSLYCISFLFIKCHVQVNCFIGVCSHTNQVKLDTGFFYVYLNVELRWLSVHLCCGKLCEINLVAQWLTWFFLCIFKCRAEMVQRCLLLVWSSKPCEINLVAQVNMEKVLRQVKLDIDFFYFYLLYCSLYNKYKQKKPISSLTYCQTFSIFTCATIVLYD